jgi:diadenosine tetraphosphate (Ap4A) HIT family hydrolase
MIMACNFCTGADIGERTIAENSRAFAFLTNKPITPGHVLISPRRCVATFDELTEDERTGIFLLLSKLKPVLIKLFKADGFNYAWNENAAAGQTVPHFHLHMIPRQNEDRKQLGYDPRQHVYRPSEERETAPTEELQRVTEIIRKEL